MTLRHFLRDDDVTQAEQAEILAIAAALKKDPSCTGRWTARAGSA